MQKLSVVSVRPIRDIVYHRLKEAVLLGEIRPGERLLEADLAEQMGVSRTPVREALRRLEREGLVVWRPFRGAEVVGVERETVQQLFQVREALECLAVRLAVARIDPAAIALLRSIVEEAEAAAQSGDYGRTNTLHRRFHSEIARLSGNLPLVRLLEEIQDHINLSQASARSGPERFRQVMSEHLQIVEALAAADASRAEMAVREHLRRALAATLADLPHSGDAQVAVKEMRNDEAGTC
jgi:DNA-binding GntR family transcriptional regulator